MIYYPIRIVIVLALSAAIGYVLTPKGETRRKTSTVQRTQANRRQVPRRLRPPRGGGRKTAREGQAATGNAPPSQIETPDEEWVQSDDPILQELASWGQHDLYRRVLGALPARPLGHGCWEFDDLCRKTGIPFGESLTSAKTRLDDLNKRHPWGLPETAFDYVAFAESPSRLDGLTARALSGRILPGRAMLARYLWQSVGSDVETWNERRDLFLTEADRIHVAYFRRQHAMADLLLRGPKRVALQGISALLLRLDSNGRKVVFTVERGEDMRLEQMLDELRDRRRSLRKTMAALLGP